MLKYFLFTIVLSIAIISDAHTHPGRLAADGCHNDNVNGGRHCHKNDNDPGEVAPVIPKLDTLSYLCQKVKVVKVYDGDTITIEIEDRHVSVRLAGIDAPEINAKIATEKQAAIRSRNYLRNLILNKEIIVLFEESDTTLDGINRGSFGRPIVYLFILDDKMLPKVKVFINQKMIDTNNAIKSKYNVDFPVLFTKGFDLLDIRVSAWANAHHGKASINPRARVSTTWAELKKGMSFNIFNEVYTPKRTIQKVNRSASAKKEH